MTRIDGSKWKGTPAPPLERFFRHVQEDAETGCWEWTGAITNGYGRFAASSGRGVIAHRWLYEQLVAPIPDGLQLDHLCRNTTCVNVYEHLDPVPCVVNVRRASDHHANRSHCPAGHPYDVENTRLHKGRRFCRACRVERRPRPDQHGTNTGYVYGCRCEPCREAARAYRRERTAA